MVTESTAWPGTKNAPPVMALPRYFTSTMSPWLIWCCWAVVGLIHTALSQVIVVMGLGISWSQALLAQVPSQMVGSGRKLTSRPCALTALPVGAFGAGAAAVAAAVFG